MTVDEKDLLEERVAEHPTDIEARTKLLGYYFLKAHRDPDARSAKQLHVQWLIENAPESEVLALPHGQLHKSLEPVAYDRAKQAWLTAIREAPDNLSILLNSSKFFLLQDRDISEGLMLKGQKLDAADPKWPESLGHLYRLGLPSLPQGPARKAAAQKAYHQFEMAYDQSEPVKRSFLLPELAKSAFEAGLIDEAKKYSKMMLEDDGGESNRGNRIHHGNLILGRIALKEGDVKEAKSRLLLAGKTEGSPQLSSFGPNMTLALELLNQGESEVVLEYFELCKGFWTSPRRELEQWAADVKASRIPRFGGNLAY